MSILNVNQIQPVGSGQTITISASDITASSATITASSVTATTVTSSSTSTFSSGLNVTGGSVGIGTDNPQDTLDVASAVPQIRLTDLSDGSYGQIRANGGNLILRADEGNTVASSLIVAEIDGNEKFRIDGDGKLQFNDSSGIVLSAKVSSLYGSNGAISYYGANNGVYVNGAGPNGFLRLNAAGSENYRNCIEIYGSTASSADTMVFRTANSEAARFTSTGNLKFASSGTGIDFSATADGSGTTSSEILDDYEEGNFDPEFADSSSGGNASTGSTIRVGWYTKIGNLVTVQVYMANVDTTGLTAGNAAWIRNLPFTMQNGIIHVGTAGLSNIDVPTGSYTTYTFGNAYSSTQNGFRFLTARDAQGHQSLTVSAFPDASNEIFVTMTYRAV